MEYFQNTIEYEGVVYLEWSEPARITPVEAWTSTRTYTDVQRILHGMKCMECYMRWIVKPQQRELKEHILSEQRKKRARWRICAILTAIHKQSIQETTLKNRASQREGLVYMRSY